MVDASQLVVSTANNPLKWYEGRRAFRVLTWVVNTQRSAVKPHAKTTDLHDPAPLRYHFRDPKAPTPFGVPPDKVHFRHGLRQDAGDRLFSGRWPTHTPTMLHAVDDALKNMQIHG